MAAGYRLGKAKQSVDHAVIRKNFSLLHARSESSQYTYGLACYIFALDAAIAQIEEDALLLAPRKVRERFRDDRRIGKQYRSHLARAVAQLVRLQREAGGWEYGPTRKPRFDNSNTQFAVLGLGVGAKRGVLIERRVWFKVLDHFVKGQQRKGPEVKEQIRLLKPITKLATKVTRQDGVVVLEGSAVCYTMTL